MRAAGGMSDAVDLIRRIRAALERRRTRWPGQPVRRLYLDPSDHQVWLGAMAAGRLPDDLATLPVREGKRTNLYLQGGQSLHVPLRVQA